ncbi:MAG: serine/threonine protein kinase [Bradymonadia bacterium]
MSETVIGQIIAARFRIDGRLGQGGYGDVYRARQLSVDRDVAIKLVHSHLEGREDVRARFEREARLASRVRHPNVVQVIDFGQHDGRLFLAMQYIPGDTLKAQLRARTPTLQESAEWISGIASGLAAAHREGVVHRDLKPGNVILSPTPQGLQPVVIDFGLVKAFENAEGTDDDVTHSNMLVGTPTYMSPEVVLGQPIDAKSDLYSLGVLAYVLLTGQKPVQGATAIETASLHLRGEIPDVRERRADCPAALAELVAELLARDPQQRPADADAVSERAQSVADALARREARDDRTLLPTLGPAALQEPTLGPPPRVDAQTPETTETLTPGGSIAAPETDTVRLAQPSGSPSSTTERSTVLRAIVAVALAVALLGVVAMWSQNSSLFDNDDGDAENATTTTAGETLSESRQSDDDPQGVVQATGARSRPVNSDSREDEGSSDPPAAAQPADGVASVTEESRSDSAIQEVASTSPEPTPADSTPDDLAHVEAAPDRSAREEDERAETPNDGQEHGGNREEASAQEATRRSQQESIGYLSTTPRPHGEIFVNGESVGGPLDQHPLRAGEYRVEVRYLDQVLHETIRIRAGETAQPLFRFEVE